MAGCQYGDKIRGICGAPIANYQQKLCKDHAANGRGMVMKTAKPNHFRGLAHLEKLNHADVSKTWRSTLCRSYLRDGVCKYGFTCAYAHGEHMLRAPTDPIPSFLVIYKATEGCPEDITMLDKPAATTKKISQKNDEQLVDFDGVDFNEVEKCTICDDYYADRMLLPCKHTSCNECITKWRKQAVQTKANGTTCFQCRRVVTGVHAMPAAEKLNAERDNADHRPKSVWGNPEDQAKMASKVVGSTLTVEEERAWEQEARRRLRAEQEQREAEQNSREEAVIAASKLHARQEQELLQSQRLIEVAARQQQIREREKALQYQANLEKESYERDRLERERASREQAEKERLARDAERERAIREETERLARVQMEKVAREKVREQEESEKARVEQERQIKENEEKQRREAMERTRKAQDVARASSSTTIDRAFLDQICQREFNAPFTVLTAVQQQIAMGMYKRARPMRPPPGYENRAGSASVVTRTSPMPSSVSDDTVETGTPRVSPAPSPAPISSSTSSTPVNMLNPAGPKAQPLSSTDPVQNGPKVDSNGDGDSDDDFSADERKKRELRRQKQRQRQQVVQQVTSSMSGTVASDTSGLSFYEVELAREAEKRLEQEKKDADFARKMAEQEELEATRPQAVAASAIPKLGAGFWSCSVCTYVNKPLYLTCDMCMTPKRT